MRFCLVLALLLLPGIALAEEAVERQVPVVEGLVLDGIDDEAGWKSAVVLKGEEIELRDPKVGLFATHPYVRVVVDGGRLWLALSLPEPVGPGVGFSAMVAPAGVASAKDATWLAFAPQSIRSPRYVARSPRGAGRQTIRLAAALGDPNPISWSVEAAVPLADLGLEDPNAPLRLAVAVRSRDASILGWVPAGSAFAPPTTWATLLPPEGGWPLDGEVVFDLANAKAEDEADVVRLAAWKRYVVASSLRIGEIMKMVGRVDALQDEGDPEAIRSTVRETLVLPLDEVLRLRPDLEIAHVFRAEVLAALGDLAEAREALARAPSLLEAQFARAFHVEALARIRAPLGEPSDWAKAFDALRLAREGDPDDLSKGGLDFAEGLLRLAHGEAATAHALLAPLAERFPFDAAIVLAAERAAKAVDLEARERQYQAREGDLPRLRVETSEGVFEVVLFEDDAPNTVRNLVWLAQNGFYDGKQVTRTVPFLGVQAGDSTGKATDPGPGYAIPTEPPAGPMKRQRMPLRGALLMLAPSPNQEGARFFVLTGTSLRLAGNFVVFGRVAQGMEVVDRLRPGAAVEKVTVLRTRPGVTYRPRTVAGVEAPVPR
jgi:peptidyl-prolyl cis-trans isomerase B (cyclophilin B)